VPIQNRLLITGATFSALSLVGMSYTFLGTSLPVARIFLNIEIERAGMLTAFLQLGFAITNIAGGILSDRMPREKVLAAGCVCLGFAAFLFGAWPLYSLNLLVATCMGIGAGLIQSGSNALLVGLYPERKGRILNLHHTLFALGSLIGPLIMGSLIARQMRWQYGFAGLGFSFLGLSLFLVLAKSPKISAGAKVSLDQVGNLLRQRDFIVLILVCFLAIGAQFALLFFAVTYLKEAKGFSIGAASVGLSALLILLGVGRLTCGWLSTRIRNSKIILALLSFYLITLIVAWKGEGWVAGIGLIMTGLACSGIFPSLLALTGTLFHEVTGTALGILAMMSGLGGMSVCWITALISQRTTLGFGFITFILSSFVSLVLFGLFYSHFLKEENEKTRS
jgi:MFS transporter, FHS family, glucose/mannose:H+ symporter